MANYFGFIEQCLHYFERPHEHLPREPLTSAAAWRGSELGRLDELAYHLSDEEIDELVRAVEHACSLSKPTRELAAADLPLTRLLPRIQSWRRELSTGLGFQVIRGVPVDTWTKEQSERFFWCLGLHLGVPGEQNPEGHLLGHVRDAGGKIEESADRLYKTSSNIDYHCDAADVVGLLCLNKARSGGHSRIVSSVTVFNELWRRRPDLIPRLFEPVLLDIRDREVDEAGSTLPIPPCRFAQGVLRTFYHADYFRSVERHAEVGALDRLTRDLFDTYESIASEPDLYLDMDLQPGDIQLLSNHTNLHARTGYVDHENPDERRHLLRLWLSLH